MAIHTYENFLKYLFGETFSKCNLFETHCIPHIKNLFLHIIKLAVNEGISIYNEEKQKFYHYQDLQDPQLFFFENA